MAILGCTGYTGIELVNILIKHPNVKITFLGTHNFEGKNIYFFDKRLKNKKLPKLELIKNVDCSSIDLVFLSLPHNISQNIIKNNYGKCKFIDLSADFRLKDPKVYKNNYKYSHKCPNLLKEFTYGLPEIYFKNIKSSNNIAVPGCYPTSILLPLIPIINDNLIKTNNIIIDSKSGYSGAGKKFEITNLFDKNEFNFYNYNTNQHRHISEIYQELNKFTKQIIKFSFNPHILPIFRGMMTTIYCDLKKNIKKSDIINSYKKYYSKNIFIKILNNKEDADFYSVNYSNNCLIKLFNHSDEKKIIIVSLIDNLLKGASGQAVQCMNLIYGFDENLGFKK